MHPEYLSDFGKKLIKQFEDKQQSWLGAWNSLYMDYPQNMHIREENYIRHYHNWSQTQQRIFEKITLAHFLSSDTGFTIEETALPLQPPPYSAGEDAAKWSLNPSLPIPSERENSTIIDRAGRNESVSPKLTPDFPIPPREVSKGFIPGPEIDTVSGPSYTEFRQMKDFTGLTFIENQTETRGESSDKDFRHKTTPSHAPAQNLTPANSRSQAFKPMPPANSERVPAILNRDEAAIQYLSVRDFKPVIDTRDTIKTTNNNAPEDLQQGFAKTNPSGRLDLPFDHSGITSEESRSAPDDATRESQPEYFNGGSPSEEGFSMDIEEMMEVLGNRLYQDYKRHYGQ